MTHDESFARLADMQGSDPAFFVLAVHSFIEGVLRATFVSPDPYEDRFRFFLDEFRSHLIQRAGGAFVPGMDSLTQLKNQHSLTNEVRHRFHKATVEDARAATRHLQQFCRLAGIPPTSNLNKVVDFLAAWDDHRSHADLLKELNELGYRYHISKKSSREMQERLTALEKAEAEAVHLRLEVERLDQEIKKLAEVKEHKDSKVDQLRGQLHEQRVKLKAELQAAQEQARQLDDARDYIHILSRMTALTRTRADYERSVIRLTQEQTKVLQQIQLDQDFLVKGAAGTGKTLVLLKAMEKAKGRGVGPAGLQNELGLSELQGSVALLTYTSTLVKYDRFLSDLLLHAEFSEEDRIATADSFVLERLQELIPEAVVDYVPSSLQELAARHEVDGISIKELAAEAEIFIWANGITRGEYLDAGIERRGMKKPLAAAMREKIWAAVEDMAAEMDSTKQYTRCYAACSLVRGLASGDLAPAVDYIFIDEAQDLPAILLKALKLCARRSLVLAGDADQSIYQPGFSFRRAGIDISGRTRILRTNFRNTLPVHQLAEAFRLVTLGHDTENQPEAFRPGPVPELFQAANRNELLDCLLVRLRLFIKTLGYDAENICILVPLSKDIDFIRERLEAEEFTLADIRDPEFSFAAPGAIRISTLHSAKGLDFPVVLPFLYRTPYYGDSHDEAAVEQMTANLLYVALTRAMDHLNLFMLEEPSSTVYQTLVRLIQQQTG